MMILNWKKTIGLQGLYKKTALQGLKPCLLLNRADKARQIDICETVTSLSAGSKKT